MSHFIFGHTQNRLPINAYKFGNIGPQVLIVGGGTGGIMTAAQLLKARPQLQIALIEPSETHYYQPAWTLVGAGTFRKAATCRAAC